MQIISFATEDSNWRSPRMGIILRAKGHDTGYRLDCEKLFEKSERPENPLAWFDMDGPWFQKARAEERQGNLQASANSLNHAISINPRSSSYYYVLSGIYRRLGNVEESKKALDSFTKLDQENNELEKMRRSMSKSRGAPHPGGERE